MSDQNCNCDCPETIELPFRGFSMRFDASKLPGGAGLKPGPDGTHLVSRNGELVWEPSETNFDFELEVPGHLTFPNGLKLMWGDEVCQDKERISFPEPFQNNCLSLQITESSYLEGGVIQTVGWANRNKDGFNVRMTPDSRTGIHWFAIGF